MLDGIERDVRVAALAASSGTWRSGRGSPDDGAYRVDQHHLGDSDVQRFIII